MSPGHVPIITTADLPLSNRYRIQFWRIRTAVHAGTDAPDPFQQSALAAGSSSAPPSAARPGRVSLPGSGTYPEEFSQAEARLILRCMTGVAAVCLAALLICMAAL